MQNNKETLSLIRLLKYAISEAESLGFTEVSWAKDLSGGRISLARDRDISNDNDSIMIDRF